MPLTYVLIGVLAGAGAARARAGRGGGGRGSCCCIVGGGRRRRARDRSRSARRGSTPRRSRPARPAIVFAALVGAGCAGGAADGGSRARVAGRADRRRGAVVERARLPRGQPRAARPARGARADRRPNRRRGPDADDRVRALRRAPLPARGRSPRAPRSCAAGAVPLRSGRRCDKLEIADIDEFALRRAARLPHAGAAPVARREPAALGLPAAARGRFYDVWQLAPGLASALLEHIPLGDGSARRARPRAASSVRSSRALARHAGRPAGGRPAPAAARVGLSAPPPARTGGRDPARCRGAVIPATGPRDGDHRRVVPAPGGTTSTCGARSGAAASSSVDGRRVASERHRLSHAGHYEPLGGRV